MTPNTTRLSVTALEDRDCPASLASMAQTLVAQTVVHAKQLVNDVSTIEYYRPTVARQAIVNDLVALNNAADSRNIDAIFVGTAKLLTDLQAEARLISAYRLNQVSPLNYQAVRLDFSRLVVDRITELRIILAAQQQAQTVQRVQVQQQFKIPPISASLASIQASQKKLAHLDTLQRQQDAYFSKDWVKSFGS